MGDLRAWLAQRGLSALHDRLAAEDVDLTLLRGLTDADFLELGFSLGERKRLRRALSSDEAAADAAEADDRRRVTLLFLDMVGFSALSRRVEPELLRELALRFHVTVERVVGDHGGRVVQRMGDGALCVFGWPVAIEGSAAAAVSAGLAGIAATQTLRVDGAPLQARGGAATGLVVRSTDDEAFFGETPNLAARLQSLAPPGGLFIAEETRALVGAAFRCRRTAVEAVKGFVDLSSVHHVVAPANIATRFAARAVEDADGLADGLIGRDDDLARLQDRARRAASGRGGAVVIEGEAGIGKSRLAEALVASLNAPADVGRFDVLRLQCAPERASSPFYAVRRLLAQIADIDRADDRSRIQGKLADRLAGGGAEVLADLFSRDAKKNEGLNFEQARRARRLLLEALCAEFVARAQRRPLLLLAEDVHWIDASSQAFLEALSRHGPARRLLLIATARPGAKRPLRLEGAERIALARLSAAEGLAVARRTAAGSGLSDRDLEQIRLRGEGVPLFIEELAKAAACAGVSVRAASRAAAAPASLHDCLMSRLDGDPLAKKTAQNAACIGRRFSAALLAGAQDEAVETALERLLARGVIREEGDAYSFTHALLRDAAYESLVRERRVEVHRRLLIRLAEKGTSDPEVLARHAEGSDDAPAAVDYRRAAARLAIRRAAYQEAAEQLDAADALLAGGARLAGGEPQADAFGAPPERDALRMRLAAGASFAWIAAEGYLSAGARAAVGRVEPLLAVGAGGPDRFAAAYAAWTLRLATGPHQEALDFIEGLRGAPEAAEGGSQRFFIEAFSGYSLLALGRLTEADQRLTAARAAYDPGTHERGADRVGHAPGRDLTYRLAFLRMLQGDADAASALIADVEHDLQSVEAHGAAQLLMKLGLLAWLAGDWPTLRRYAEELDAMARRAETPLARIVAAGYRHAAAAAEGDADALSALSAANAAYENEVMLFLAAPRRLAESELALGLGALDAAERACARAGALIGRTGERLAAAEAERIRGAIACARGDVSEASARLGNAEAIAARQGARLWSGRAAAARARLRL